MTLSKPHFLLQPVLSLLLLCLGATTLLAESETKGSSCPDRASPKQWDTVAYWLTNSSAEEVATAIREYIENSVVERPAQKRKIVVVAEKDKNVMLLHAPVELCRKVSQFVREFERNKQIIILECEFAERGEDGQKDVISRPVFYLQERCPAGASGSPGLVQGRMTPAEDSGFDFSVNMVRVDDAQARMRLHFKLVWKVQRPNGRVDIVEKSIRTTGTFDFGTRHVLTCETTDDGRPKCWVEFRVRKASAEDLITSESR